MRLSMSNTQRYQKLLIFYIDYKPVEDMRTRNLYNTLQQI